jgi:hypothetical protein
MSRQFVPLLRQAITVIALIGSLTWTASASTVVPMSLGDIVRESGAIVVGTILSASAHRLDDNPAVIVTQCVVGVDDAIAGTGAATVTLTFWGGTLGDETQEIAGMPVPRAGERFVMFLRPGALAGGVAPTVGLFQGLLRVVSDPATGEPVLQEANGGRVRASIASLAVPAGSVRLSDFVAGLKANLAVLRATPVSPELSALRSGAANGAAMSLPTVLPVRRTMAASAADAAPVLPAADGDGGSAPDTPRDPIVRPGGGTLEPGRPAGAPSSYSWLDGVAATPIVFNQLPASITPWSPVDQHMLSLWNYYADIFRVKTTASGTYSYGDNIFDVAGFPSSADLNSIYGTTWEAVGSVIGMTFIRRVNNRIVEADVALRPNGLWTTSDEPVYAGELSRYSYRHTMFHEFGHAWGALHYNNDLAHMGYPSTQAERAYTIPYMDDAEGIRTLYSGTARTDLAVHMFRWTSKFSSGGSEYWSSTDATFPASADTGSDFTVRDFTVANAGTTTISTPTIEWYLTQYRNFDGAYYYLGSTTHSSLPRFTRFNSTISATVHVPASMPSGYFYLAAFIRNDDGASLSVFPYSNNRAFSRAQMYVSHVCSMTISPGFASVRGGTGTGYISVDEREGCPWTATSNSPDWLKVIDGASGDGAGTVTYKVDAHLLGFRTPRRGSITIGTKVFTVSQTSFVATQMALEAPASGAVVTSPVAVRGWAINESAWTLAGVDAVHVYAYPATGLPIFLGAATYGEARPDIGAIFGLQFSGSGFTLTAPLAPGTYNIVAYARSTPTGVFDASKVAVNVTVKPPVTNPFIDLDTPREGYVVTSSFEVGGWALDAGSPTGTGVDAVQFYVFPNNGNAPGVFIGSGSYGLSRPDVAGFFGSRFTNTGFHFSITGLGPGGYVLGVNARSTVTGGYTVVKQIHFTVNANQLMAVSPPAAEAAITGNTFDVDGWSIDKAVESTAIPGTGVDTLHVYAYPNPGSGAPPIFLGVATYGLSRPDVAMYYGGGGPRYVPSGFHLSVNRSALGLTNGPYNIVVHSHSRVTGTFNNVAVVRVTLQ